MNQDVSAPALIQLAHRYYPASIDADDPRYEDSQETRRLSALLDAAMKDTGPWELFVRRLEDSFPGCEVRDESSLPHAPNHCCSVRLSEARLQDGEEENAVVCMLSLLAPVYVIYATHEKKAGLNKESWRRFPPLPREFQAREARLASLIETTFGFTRLSNDVLFIPVPDLRKGLFGTRSARLLECLF